MNKLFPIAVIEFLLYILVLIAILADLWAGLRKAKQQGVIRSSYGFRRTIDKIVKYYNAMLIFGVIDAMQIMCLLYLEKYYSFTIPTFPFISLGGAMGCAIIEVKSIYEKNPQKSQVDGAINLLRNILLSHGDVGKVTEDLKAFITEAEQNDKQKEAI